MKVRQEREAGCGSGGESGGGGGGSSVGVSDFRLLFCCVNVALMLSCCLHYLLVNRVRLENQPRSNMPVRSLRCTEAIVSPQENNSDFCHRGWGGRDAGGGSPNYLGSLLDPCPQAQ